MHPGLVAGIAGLIAVAGTATVAHQTGLLDAVLGPNAPEESCAELPLVGPAETANALVDFRVENTDEAGPVHACLIDMEGTKRWEYRGVVPARTTTDLVAAVPAESYHAKTHITGSGGGSASAWGFVGVGSCANHEAVVDVETTFNGRDGITLGISGGSGRCGAAAKDSVAPAGLNDGDRIVPTDKVQAGTGGAIITGGLTVGALGGLFVWQRRELAFLAARLFTRLDRPAILDQATRARIHELVAQEPGIHGSVIAQRLELASGQAVHHLRVLVRERMLSRVGSFGSQHFFPYGKYAPQQMRLLAALRHRAASRLYHAVLAQPGGSLTEVSERSGISLGRASRLAQRLSDTGLVIRRPHGRLVLLAPAAGPERAATP